ncbi:unnamed protein product [Clonostachys chloroleuca]|uniref:F-box domain-containing protein n=1 Tax=Clonostachys chloroleuca TaxID=1926264 RepID=A0AA35M8N0_9HYPO|nr:unnamed protein product [Clonostachys chloroleuca]
MEQQAKPRPTTLLGLPPEIQTKIFSHLAVSFGKPSIQAILRTCKQFYNVALPISVSIFRNTVHYLEGGGPCSSARNVLFLRYILVSKPFLAKYVKTVIVGSLSSGEREERRDENPGNGSTDQDLVVYQQQIETILGAITGKLFYKTSRWRTAWAADLKAGSRDAQVTLILLTCPNILTLLYEKTSQCPHFHTLIQLLRDLYLKQNIRYVTGISHTAIPLSNLQDVFHEANNDKVGCREFYLEAPRLFALPHLRFYECIMAYGNDEAAKKFRRLPPRSSSVEDINLHSSYATASLLRDMLNSCRALKKFEFIRGMYDLPEEAMPRDFLEAILPHADTLEDLYVNLEDDWDHGWSWSSCPERLYMGTELSQMHALKRLTLGMRALTGMLAGRPENHEKIALQMPMKVEGAPRLVDCLPENLEYLQIHHCGEGILTQAKELISVAPRRFKKLTYLGLLFNEWELNGKVDLSCTSPSLTLDIGYQIPAMVMYDLGRMDIIKREGDLIRNLTSRIYSENVRRIYLDLRGVGDVRHAQSYPYIDDPDSFEE